MFSFVLSVLVISCAILLRRQYTVLRQFARSSFDLTAVAMQFDNVSTHLALNAPIPPNTIAEDRPDPFSFSACLLAKDVNIILPEWLAYHYTFLPLRRLIVAVDPMTETDPTPTLDLYRSLGVNITIWTNHTDAYWVDGKDYWLKSDYVITNETIYKKIRDRHKHRQKIFYKGCLQQLHREGRSWTALVDADEYIAFNHICTSKTKFWHRIQS